MMIEPPDLAARASLGLLCILFVQAGKSDILRLASAQPLDDSAGWLPIKWPPDEQPRPSSSSIEIHDELAAQQQLLETLESARQRLDHFSELNMAGQLTSKCFEFNSSLGDALIDLRGLIELAQPSQSIEQLHEEADLTRRMQALRAYEAIGSTVSAYFECVGQLGELGLWGEQLEDLLPISDRLGALGGVIEQAATREDLSLANVIEWQPNDGAGREEQPEAIGPSDRSFVDELSGRASGLYDKTKDLFGLLHQDASGGTPN